MTKFAPVHTIYIASTPQRVWHALTDPDLSQQYFFGRRVTVEPRVGGAFRITMQDGTVDSFGTVREWSPPTALEVTWRVDFIEEYRKLPEAFVRYEIKNLRGAVRLTVLESHDESVDDKYLEGGRKGWPMILSGLKTVIETGKPMPEFDYSG